MQGVMSFDEPEVEKPMSTHRTNPNAGAARPSTLPKGPHGRCLCRYCGKEVPTGRVTFCGAACIHEHKLRSDTSYLRSQVFLRDRGVCRECGRDTEVWRRSAMGLRPRARILYLQSLGIPPHRTTFWDADHILPVALGGGECDLSNIVSLCYGCHAKKTARQAAEIRAAKASSAPPPRKQKPSAAAVEAQRAFDEKQRRLGHVGGIVSKGDDSPC